MPEQSTAPRTLGSAPTPVPDAVQGYHDTFGTVFPLLLQKHSSLLQERTVLAAGSRVLIILLMSAGIGTTPLINLSAAYKLLPLVFVFAGGFLCFLWVLQTLSIEREINVLEQALVKSSRSAMEYSGEQWEDIYYYLKIETKRLTRKLPFFTEIAGYVFLSTLPLIAIAVTK